MTSKSSNKETEGNILIFYALQYAASQVLKSRLEPLQITCKSPIKAQVQYSYLSQNGISNDQKKQIEMHVNNMLKSNTTVLCSQFDKNNDCKIPKGLNGNLQLFEIKINDNFGVSHIPIISINNLGINYNSNYIYIYIYVNIDIDIVLILCLLSDFKILKCNFKSNKNVLEIYYSFKVKIKTIDSKKAKKEECYFDDAKVDEKDDRTAFSKEIIELVLNDLDIKSIKNMKKDNLDKLVGKVHDVLNQFQSISYAKGYKAARKK